MKNLIRRIINIVKRCYYFEVKFDKGYSYKRIKTGNLKALEIYHGFLLADGWEKYTDVEASFLSAWVWYRRLNN